MVLFFGIKKGDTYPPIKVTVKDGDGAIINLTGATAKFRLLKASDKSQVLNNDAVILVPATNGQIQYNWSGTDTATIGEYVADFKVTLGGTIFSAPSDSYIKVDILP